MLSKPPFSMLDTFSKVDDAIDVNANLAEAIVNSSTKSMGFASMSGDETDGVSEQVRPEWYNCATKVSLDKARSTLHQLYRDWSVEGVAERQACYGPVLQDLLYYLPSPLQNQQDVRVLVPGAGLGRLVFELSRAGYHAQGNEISYHQLLTSSFMLNHTTCSNEWRLHPFALSFSNNLTRADQLLEVRVPDVHPGSVAIPGSMSMTTGDFCLLYKGEEYKSSFDAVATVFFIDTAPNVISYIEAIKNCLKLGGIWSNLGPLLWHFDGQSTTAHDHDEASDTMETEGHGGIDAGGRFEMSHDEIITLVESLGFEILKQGFGASVTGYIQNPNSMLRNTYHPAHWVARKTSD